MKITQALAVICFLALTACAAKESLTAMTQGLFAAPPEIVALQIQNYRPQAGHSLQNLFVSNYSVTARQGQLSYSSARDLPDDFKIALAPTYGFTVASPESAVNGFADILLFQMGLNLSQQPLLTCAYSLNTSSTADGLLYNDSRYLGSPLTFLGLRDCDKLYVGLDPTKFSFNGSGIPDYLQMRCGLNPLSTNAPFVSTAGDGISNLDKCRRHIPIDESATTQPNELYAYVYDNVLNADGSINLNVSNIPVLNGGADNFIAIYLTETDSSTHVTSFYSAYAVLKSGYAGKTLSFDYWATSSATFTNTEIVVP